MSREFRFHWFLRASVAGLLLAVNVAHAAPPDAKAFEEGDSLDQIRAKIAYNGYSFTVAPNWVYNMSAEEKKVFLGRHPSVHPVALKGATDIGPLQERLNDIPKESAFSWLDYGGHSYIGPVRNQGSCGSCYAFGACAAAEGSYNYANGFYDGACADFSEAFVAFCLGSLSEYSDHFGGCDGADYDYYELQALVDEGVCNESVFPYVDSDPGTCSTHWTAPRTRFEAWYRVPCGDVNAIKAAIRYYGVVDAAILATSAFDAYSGGVYEDTNTECTDCEYTASNHAIGLVGWDDNPPEGGGGCWILRNSWGAEDWGEDGYMRIRYTSSGVACAVTYLVHSQTPPAPPAAGVSDPTSVTSFGAVLNGFVIPNGAATTYHFEYGPTGSYGQVTPTQSAGSGRELESVLAPISGLTPFSTYHVQIVADSAQGHTESDDLVFMTRPEHAILPESTSGGVGRLSRTSAVLDGSFNPYGFPTTCYFEYGPTTAYGKVVVPEDGEGAPVDSSGMKSVAVSSYVWGLLAGTTYHWRLVASNDAGLTYGADRQLDTPELPPCVFFEEFENGGSLPVGWSQQYVSGSLNWWFVDGDWGLGFAPEAVSGSYNGFLFGDDSGFTTRLLSPAVNLQFAPNPLLTFWRCMPDWWGDQDELRVYYRTSPSAAWTLLKAFADPVYAWTQETVSLPDSISTCYLAFEGQANYGFGISLDDVCVAGAGLVLTEQPEGGWYMVGDSIQLTVGVAGAVGTVSYHWYKDGASIDAVTSPVLSLPNLTYEDQGSYWCEVSDDSKAIASTSPAYIRVVGQMPGAGLAGLAACGVLVSVLGAFATRKQRN